MTRLQDRFRVRLAGALVASAMLAGSTAPAFSQESTPPPPGDSEVAAQLPAADLPDMNEQGFLLDLESKWTGSFDDVPAEAPVIRMGVQQFDAESVATLASKLGIDGEVEDQGGGTFQVSSDSGNLFVTPGLQQYVSTAEIPEGDLPDDEEAVAFAREWLRQTGLLPADAGDGRVLERVDNPARVLVSIEPVRPDQLISQYPSITVNLGPDGIVLEAAFRWSDLSAEEVYALRPVGEAWTDVAEQRAALQPEIPGDAAEAGSTVAGNATYDSVAIAYTTSGVPGQTQYLQPVYVFTGTVTLEGSEESYNISAYVPALVNSQQPVG
jgi:hypothetical protein